MDCPSWNELRRLWREDEGALRDIYVTDVSVEDWQRVIEAVQVAPWRTVLFVGGSDEASALPTNTSDVFATARERGCVWRIYVTDSVSVNCHFHDKTEIEFDLAPEEINDQSSADAICEFLRVVGRSIGRPVSVCVEGLHVAPSQADMHYDPGSDAVVRGTSA